MARPAGWTGWISPGGEEVTQAQERGDRQEALDPWRALADDTAGLEAVHPAHEVPADPENREQEAGLDEVARPLDAAAAGAERRALQDLGRGYGVELDVRPCLAESGAG